MSEEKALVKKPKVSTSLAHQEVEKLEKQFDAQQEHIESLTMDRLNQTPKKEEEPQTKLSQKEIEKTNDIYLKPVKVIGCGGKDKFNEKFRAAYEYDKEYVYFIAENKEIIGETIDIWTRPYGGLPAEEWKVPVNKPVWGPRYLAEQIKRKFYHRLVMQEATKTVSDGAGTYYGAMVADTTVQRLDARPVSRQKSIFMGANNF